MRHCNCLSRHLSRSCPYNKPSQAQHHGKGANYNSQLDAAANKQQQQRKGNWHENYFATQVLYAPGLRASKVYAFFEHIYLLSLGWQCCLRSAHPKSKMQDFAEKNKRTQLESNSVFLP